MVLTGCLQREYRAVLFLAPLPLDFRDRMRTDEVKFEACEEGGRIFEREEMEPYTAVLFQHLISCYSDMARDKESKDV